MSGPAVVNPLIQQTEYEGCYNYQNDIRAARKDNTRVGNLTVKGNKTVTVSVWSHAIRKIQIKAFETRSFKIGVFGIAAIISSIAALILAAVTTAIAAPFGMVTILAVAGMFYHHRKFNRDKEGFRRQTAYFAQYYLAEGPIKAMQRKWELGRLETIDDIDLLQSNDKIKKELDDAMQAIQKPFGGKSQPSDTSQLAKLLLPQQKIFDKLKISKVDQGKEDILTEIVLKWFQGNHKDGKVALYCQRQDPTV